MLQMTAPTVSVAMSVYNGEQYLSEAINSILSQTFADFEFLILDDGSTDKTPDIIRSYASTDARIRPIIRENRGLITSLNQLLMEARAPLIARMDADDIAEPSRFQRQIAFFMEHPEVGVLGTWSQDIDIAGKPIETEALDHPITHEDFLRAVSTGQALICHPSVMFRTDIVRAVGGYHSAFKHCEDLDLWLRLATQTKIANLPERLLHYRHNDNQVSRKFSSDQQYGAAISRLAYQERLQGRNDPTKSLAALPPLTELDALFSRAGTADAVRTTIIRSLVYSKHAMSGQGFNLLITHLQNGGDRTGLWRTIPRLITFGMSKKAIQLAFAFLR